MKQVCKVCRLEKFKIKTGKRKTGSIFVDEVGREWFGRQCNDCGKKRIKVAMRQLRQERKNSDV